jgi:hypothetical protein
MGEVTSVRGVLAFNFAPVTEHIWGVLPDATSGVHVAWVLPSVQTSVLVDGLTAVRLNV